MGSTRESIKVDICRECHPFYSGNQKLIDTAGRVDRFREKMAMAQKRQVAKAPKVKQEEPELQTLKEENVEDSVTPTDEVTIEPAEADGKDQE